jgi:hypothetical protein
MSKCTTIHRPGQSLLHQEQAQDDCPKKVTVRGNKRNITSNGNFTFYVNSATSLYPTKFDNTAQHIKDDDITVATSNTQSTVPNVDLTGATFALKTKDALADSGATQIFIMEGTKVPW